MIDLCYHYLYLLKYLYQFRNPFLGAWKYLPLILLGTCCLTWVQVYTSFKFDVLVSISQAGASAFEQFKH